MYVYLIGSGLYFIVWLFCFIKRKDLRKKIFFMSLWAGFLGISEKAFIPAYWVPQFKTIPLYGEIFLESILFSFFLGGVVAVFYQVLFNRGLFKLIGTRYTEHRNKVVI